MTWTAKMVSERIEEAMETQQNMTPIRLGPKGYRSSLPQYIRTAFENYMNSGDPWGLYAGVARAPKVVPSSVEIDKYFEVMEWLGWLSRKERQVLMALAVFRTWDYLEARFKRSRRAIKRWEAKALERICERLNG